MLQGRVKGNIIECLLLLVLTAGSYLGVNALKWQNETRGIQAVMALLLAGCAGYMLLLKGLKRWKEDRAVMVVIVMGCIMRIGYMLYTPVTLRCHDIFELDVNAYGKAGYLLRLAVEGRLPESNVLQLYQQPFYYMAGAFVSRLLNGILGSEDMFLLVDAAKVVSCWASCMTLVLVEKIFQMLGISKKSTWYGMMAAAFGPVFYLTGGRMGEDALCTFFMTAVLLYTMYWEKNPGWKNTIVLALFYGFGMMTKISLAVPALYTVWVFMKKLWIEKLVERTKDGAWSFGVVWGVLTDKESLRLYGKMLVFACISLTLGLWYSVRNMILFGQGLTYVLQQDVNGPLYQGKMPLVQRFLLPDVENLLETPYANPLSDYNLFAYLLKTELFGEFTYQVPEWIPMLLLFCNFCISLSLVGYSVWLIGRIVKGKQSGAAIVPAVWMLLFTGFAAYSYLSYPFGCTMDFRYYAMIAVCKALLTGRLLDGVTLNTQKTEIGMLQSGMKKLLVCFGVFSCLMYCVI